MFQSGWIALSLSLLVSFGQAALRPDPPNVCSSCDEWNQPHEPFRVFGNTYYVGTGGLSAILITSDQGHILLDGGLAANQRRVAADSAARVDTSPESHDSGTVGRVRPRRV